MNCCEITFFTVGDLFGKKCICIHAIDKVSLTGNATDMSGINNFTFDGIVLQYYNICNE